MLRDYQAQAIHETLVAWGSGTRRPALLMATGLGKTVVFAELARLMATQAARRPVVLVHRDELVRQSVSKLQAADPALRIGVIQGPEMGIARTDIVVASVQTLIRRLGVIDPSRFDLLIVDECHHASAVSYQRILEHFGAFDFDSRTLSLGVTATMARGDKRGLGDVWDKVVFERDIRYGVENGHLVPAEVRTVRLAGLDTDTIRKIDGDLAPGPLAKAMSGVGAGPIIARAYSEFGRDEAGRFRRAIVFAPTIETAQAWACDFRDVGARIEVVTGKTPTEARQAMYARVGAGMSDALISVMVLVEGFDLPAVEVGIIGRPTKNMALLTQMAGRVLRPSPATGKTCALLIDAVGAMGAGLARSLDLGIPGPPEPVAPAEPTEPMGPRPPEEFVAPPVVEWVALDLHGAPIPAAERRRGHAGPDWLRTYGGIPFLPPTVDYPETIFAWAAPDGRGPWWRKPRHGPPEPLVLAERADVREIHPGVRRPPAMVLATDKQAELLRRFTRPDGTPLLGPDEVRPSARVAGELLSVHFASRALDGLLAPAFARVL